MKSLLFAFLLFFSFSSFGQSKLDIIGSLNYSDLHGGLDHLAGNIRSPEKGKLNSHFAINYNHKLKEKIWLRVGLGFTSMGYKDQLFSNLRFGSQHDGMGNFDPTLPGEYDDFQLKYNYQFLEIPIALRYEFSQKKLKPFAEVGISSLYYLQTTITNFKNRDPLTTEKVREEGTKEIQYAPILSFGFSYNFNEKWELIVQPNFRYHLTKIVKVPTKWHLWSGGLAVGMRMKLK